MPLHTLTTPKDFSRELGIAQNKLEEAIRTGEIHGIPTPKDKCINNCVYFDTSAIETWKANLHDKNCEGM
jgi:hypothetical protein